VKHSSSAAHDLLACYTCTTVAPGILRDSVTNQHAAALNNIEMMNGYAVTRIGESEEQRTVEEARAGGGDAWHVLFDAHHPKLYRYFRSRLDSAQDAEDLAAEVFVEAYRSMHTFRWRNRPFEAWLFGIARHRLLMHFRRRRETSELPESVSQLRDEYLGIEIRDVLERLPDDYRHAIELRYALGLSGIEAAAAMGRSHGAFRTLLSRATVAFKNEYGRER